MGSLHVLPLFFRIIKRHELLEKKSLTFFWFSPHRYTPCQRDRHMRFWHCVKTSLSLMETLGLAHCAMHNSLSRAASPGFNPGRKCFFNFLSTFYNGQSMENTFLNPSWVSKATAYFQTKSELSFHNSIRMVENAICKSQISDRLHWIVLMGKP